MAQRQDGRGFENKEYQGIVRVESCALISDCQNVMRVSVYVCVSVSVCITIDKQKAAAAAPQRQSESERDRELTGSSATMHWMRVRK